LTAVLEFNEVFTWERQRENQDHHHRIGSFGIMITVGFVKTEEIAIVANY